MQYSPYQRLLYLRYHTAPILAGILLLHNTRLLSDGLSLLGLADRAEQPPPVGFCRKFPLLIRTRRAKKHSPENAPNFEADKTAALTDKSLWGPLLLVIRLVMGNGK